MVCVCNSNKGVAGRVLQMVVPGADCVLPLQSSFSGTHIHYTCLLAGWNQWWCDLFWTLNSKSKSVNNRYHLHFSEKYISFKM